MTTKTTQRKPTAVNSADGKPRTNRRGNPEQQPQRNPWSRTKKWKRKLSKPSNVDFGQTKPIRLQDAILLGLMITAVTGCVVGYLLYQISSGSRIITAIGTALYATVAQGAVAVFLKDTTGQTKPPPDVKIRKFSSILHLIVPAKGDKKGDKVLTPEERAEFLTHHLTLEEKLDGANIGISFEANGKMILQSRTEIITFPTRMPTHQQLRKWATKRKKLLRSVLGTEYILHGEWMYNRHAVFYDQLPDMFIGIDIREKDSDRFLSVERRNQILDALGITKPPFITAGTFTEDEIV